MSVATSVKMPNMLTQEKNTPAFVDIAKLHAMENESTIGPSREEGTL